METQQQVLHTLVKGLHAEFSAIKFYLDNLVALNYRGNKNALTTLTMDSLLHAKALAEEILSIQAEAGGQLNKDAVQKALAEEFSMREIYRFEMERTDSSEVKKLMKHLIEEEKTHEHLVDGLK